MANSTKRLFIGGLASSITEDEIKSRFEKFGDVTGVNLVKKDSVNGKQEHCFAHFTYKGDEKQLKKLMSTFNNTRWKGRSVRIEHAKEDFLDRLAQEKKAKVKVKEKEQPSKREDALVINLKKAGVEDFVKKKAVPGTAIDGVKNWVVGKYGRVLPVVYLRRKDKRKVAKFDPSKYSHHLKQIKDEDTLHGSKISSITWQMENSPGHSQKRQPALKQKTCVEKSKNSNRRRSKSDSGYMFNFFANEEENGDDEHGGTISEEDSESDSDITEDSGPSVPNMRRKSSSETGKQPVKMGTNTSQDCWQPTLSEGRCKDLDSDSKQKHHKEGTLTSREVKHKVISRKSEMCDENENYDVKHQENVLTVRDSSDKKCTINGSILNARSEYYNSRNDFDDGADDSSLNDSDNDTSGSDDGSSVSGKGIKPDDDSADTDEVCSTKQKQSQIKVKTAKNVNSVEFAGKDENAPMNQKNFSSGDCANDEKPSGSGSSHDIRSDDVNISNSVDDVGISSEDTSGNDDDDISEDKKEVELDNESDEADQICNRKSKQIKADAKTAQMRGTNCEVLIHLTECHRSSNVNVEDAVVSFSSKQENEELVRKSGRESNDPGFDTDGSIVSSSVSGLKRKRESNEGLSDSDSIGSIEKGKDRREGVTEKRQSCKKIRLEEEAFAGALGKMECAVPQDNLSGANFELLVLDRDVLLKQGYIKAEHEGEEESSWEDGSGLSGSTEDSDSDDSLEQEGKKKSKKKIVIPAFKGMNLFRKHFRDTDSNDCKESHMCKGQDLSTDEINTGREDEVIMLKEGLSPTCKEVKSLKKRKRRKENNLDVGDSFDTEEDGATQLKMRMGKESSNSSDEKEKQHVHEERNTDELLSTERKDEMEAALCKAEDIKEEVTLKGEILSKKLLEDSGRGRDADDESSDLENLVEAKAGSSSKKRKKKKHKEEENDSRTGTRGNVAAFSNSLSLINAVQNKYSKSVELPKSNSAGEGEINEATKDVSAKSELQSERALKDESVNNTSGGESVEDTGKTFTDRIAEFGRKFVEKRKIAEDGIMETKRKKNLSEKPQSCTDKVKDVTSNQDTAEISNQRRLQAIKERQQEVKNKQKAIQAALAKVDDKEKPDAKKHMRFDSESDKDPEVAEEAEVEIKNSSKEMPLSLFTGENNEKSDSDEDWFQVKPQFEGEKGLQLLKLQQRFGDDQRFKLDERFAEDEEDGDEDGNNAEEKPGEDVEEVDLETEKTKALSILENVLGNMLPAKKSTDDKKAKFRDIGQVRFDPSREDHAKFLLPQREVSEANSKSKKKRKKKKNTEEEKRIVEEPLPEVSKEVFYNVKSDLTSALTQSEPVTFSFFNENEDEEAHGYKEEEYFQPPADFVWEKKKLPYDSSDSEREGEEEEDTTKQEALSLGKSKEVEEQSSKSFFFRRNDHRLKDGASQFCRPKDFPFKDNWQERRTELWTATHKRHQKALRDSKQNMKHHRPFKHH